MENTKKDSSLLSAEEEIELAKRIMNGDTEARNILIEKNLRLVYSEAKKFKSTSRDYEDLIQEGSLGLIRAVDLYDYTKGFRFSTYAVCVIRSFIKNYLSSQCNLVNIGRHTICDFNKIKKEIANKKTDEEVCTDLNIKKRTLDNYKIYSQSSYKLFSDIIDDEKRNFIENNIAANADPEVLEDLINDEIIKMVKLSLDALNQKEKYVIKHKYGIDGKKKLSLREMGKHYNLTKARIKQIISIAEEKMAKSIKKDKRFNSEYYN